MVLNFLGTDILMHKREPSSSERSVSIEASNSEDERSDVRHVHTASEVNLKNYLIMFVFYSF